MALTVQRWIAVAALGCAALALAYLPPQPSNSVETAVAYRTLEKRRVDRLNEAYEATRGELTSLRFRDSLRRALKAPRRDTNSVEVAFRVQLPTQSSALVRAAAQRLWKRLDPVPGSRLVFILGTGRSWRASYVLPSVLDGRTCVAAIPLDRYVEWLKNRNTDERGTNLQPWLSSAAGPCLYYGAFGRPGRAIEAWLVAHGMRPAYIADWSSPIPTLGTNEDPNRYEYQLYNASFDALACGDGRTSRCTAALMDHTGPNRSVEGFVLRSYWTGSFPGEHYYLATLVREMGRDRFGNFWRSTKSVDAAFVDAFGQPIDKWTGAWAKRFAAGMPPLGPAARPVAALFALLLASLAIVLVALLVTRRQVG